MAWKDIYNPGSSSFIAKVPSNSIYYDKPKMLIDLYQACRNDKPVGELKFGNGWLNYKNITEIIDLSLSLRRTCLVSLRIC